MQNKKIEIVPIDKGKRRIEYGDSVSQFSKLVLLDYKTAIGRNSVLKAAGIAGVMTFEEHRKKGHASVMLNWTMDHILNEGYDICILHGIPDFYHRFGFVSATPKFKLEMSVEAAQRAVSYYNIVKADISMQDSILKMHNKQPPYSGRIIREGNWWFRDIKFAGFWPETVILTDGKMTVGYAVYTNREDAMDVYEIWAEDNKGYSSLIKYFAEKGLERNKDIISIAVPIDHPFAYYSRKYGYVMHTEYIFNRAFMARLINLHSVLEKLIPEFEYRLTAKSFHSEASIVFDTDIGYACLVIKNDKVMLLKERTSADTVLNISQGQLTSLIFGYKRAEDILLESSIHANSDAIDILDILFPAGIPYIWTADLF